MWKLWVLFWKNRNKLGVFLVQKIIWHNIWKNIYDTNIFLGYEFLEIIFRHVKYIINTYHDVCWYPKVILQKKKKTKIAGFFCSAMCQIAGFFCSALFIYIYMNSAEQKKPAIWHIAEQKKPAIFVFFFFCKMTLGYQQTSWYVFIMYFTCLKMISKNSYPKKIFVSYIFFHILCHMIFCTKKTPSLFRFFQNKTHSFHMLMF